MNLKDHFFTVYKALINALRIKNQSLNIQESKVNTFSPQLLISTRHIKSVFWKKKLKQYSFGYEEIISPERIPHLPWTSFSPCYGFPRQQSNPKDNDATSTSRDSVVIYSYHKWTRLDLSSFRYWAYKVSNLSLEILFHMQPYSPTPNFYQTQMNIPTYN